MYCCLILTFLQENVLSSSVLSGQNVARYQGALYLGRVIKRNAAQQVNPDLEAVYMNGLLEAQHIKRQALSPGTQACKEKDLAEYESWLLKHTTRDLLSSEPSDFEAYFPGWTKVHGRNGQIASHTRAAKLVSNLRTGMEHLGRKAAPDSACAGMFLIFLLLEHHHR